MNQLLPLPVVMPLLTAVIISALKPLLKQRRRLLDGLAIAAGAVVTVILGMLVIRTAHGDLVYWVAGFRPLHRIAIGIDIVAEPLAAGLGCLAAALVTASMVFSWRYFERVSTYYHALMLTFLAGMVGFCLAGDIFDFFVWFELMSVSAYALTAYRPEERGSIQGALNFAITNSVGAFLSLSGIALVYGRTGALNMAEIGQAMGRHRHDGLVVVAFVLIITGLLIKAAIVPFHFWLADAVAVTSTPIGVLFSGVMVELSLYGVARVYWSMFGHALGHRAVLTGTFLTLGLLTAVAGALFCFRERHIKRLLAFATISNAGLLLIGYGLLTPLGLAGAAVYVIGYAVLIAALFLLVGIVLHRLGSVNETALHGQGRRLRVTGILFTLASLGLAGMPPFATFLGKGWIEDAASAAGLSWILIVIVFCSVIVGGAVLRVAGGVFYGFGDAPSEDAQMARQASEETGETELGRQHTPLSMIVPAVVLIIAALGLYAVPHLGWLVQDAAARFQDQAAYIRSVLSGAHAPHPAALSRRGPMTVTLADVLTGAGSAVGGAVLAYVALHWRRLPVLRNGSEPGVGLVLPIQQIQSGVVNDYVTWIVVGVACIGGVLAYAIR
jgi:multicomponent Na+:H+ antiporter subunit D